MEKFNREKIPACIKSLLISSGYDTLLSLTTLDKDKIEEIESYIQKNRKNVDTLQCCFAEQYQAQDKFEFLPGHKSTMLNIPEQIERMKGTKNQHTTTDKQNPKIVKLISEKECKNRLLNNLFRFTAKNGLELSEELISEVNIKEFSCGPDGADYQYKCEFSCPFCDRSMPLKFTTFWTSSNITTHLKEHIKNARNIENC